MPGQHCREEVQFEGRCTRAAIQQTLPPRRPPLPFTPSCRRAGRRNFGAFLSQYIPPMPGRYVDVDSGAELGPCPDLAAVTNGQRPGIGGAPERVYAVGKDVVR